MSEFGVTELVQEVHDLLEVGNVGLYEFIWSLHSEQPGASLDALRSQAETALREVMTSSNVQPILLIWPNFDPVGAFDPNHLPVDAWDDPEQGKPYPALRLANESQ